ncbi:hypothetical protein ABZX69_15925 [Streptomyces sp. NPDC004074]|uniref:DUF7848 domain-containing protein n=1 Tax=Streptomyces sp. NPDC004074 TaxID=3154277 RepID=UPI0033BEB2E4
MSAAPTKTYAYPEVPRTRISVDDLPSRRWVECASCIESQDIEHTSDAEEWVALHLKKNPKHDRYRIVRQTGWRIVDPPADAAP